MDLKLFFRNTAINMFFKNVVNIYNNVKALKTAFEIERMEHSSDLHNILFFALLIKEKNRL